MYRYSKASDNLPAFFLPVIALSFAVACHGWIPSACQGQSTVVDVPGESGSAVSKPRAGEIANSLSTQSLYMESLLEQPTPLAWRSEMSAGRLVEMMNQAGIQVLLDESTEDNNLDEHEPVRLALHNASIETNLRFALMPYQCDYLITETGVVRILSNDSMLDNMSRVTYDISQIAPDYDRADELISLVMDTIDPDSWDDNGGNGRMISTAAKKGQLLTVTQTFQNQQQVRQLLKTVYAMGGGPVPLNQSTIASSKVSNSVMLPEEYMALRRNRRGMALPGSGTTSGFGGGAGLGGGVF